MKKLGIRQIHNFISKDLTYEIFESYKNYEIVSEADLQSHVWQILSEYLKKNAENPRLYKILNQPYLKEIKTFPDLVIFKRGKPFIIIELKEWRKPKLPAADRELDKLITAKKIFLENHEYKIKRGYLIYTSWYWYEIGTIIKEKGQGVKFFYEIPIVPESFIKLGLKEWKNGFKKWAKYTEKP